MPLSLPVRKYIFMGCKMKSQKLVEINGEFFPMEVEEEQDLPDIEIDRKEIIVQKIREKYSIDDEIAIIRQKDTKKEEFDEYYNFVENIKKNI